MHTSATTATYTSPGAITNLKITMKTVAEIDVPQCGVYSFPLPYPEGEAIHSVLIDRKQATLKRVTDKVVHVSGVASPGKQVVNVNPSENYVPYQALTSLPDLCLRFAETQQELVIDSHTQSIVLPGGIRVTTLCEFYDTSALIYIEFANAEWSAQQTAGPQNVPSCALFHNNEVVGAFTDVVHKTLNMREHTVRVLAVGPQAVHLASMNHRIQCTGSWSYKNILAWGPQEITIPEPVNELPSRPVELQLLDPERSPLKPLGMKNGRETGGFMIETAVLPCCNAKGIRWLMDVSFRMLDRTSLWAYAKGKPCSDQEMAHQYGGTIPYRLAATNVAGQVMPEFLPGRWRSGHADPVDQDFMPYDGQHFVRPTAPIKSLIWNACDPYAIHALEQLAAHAMLVRTSKPCKDVSWGYWECNYDMLNRLPESEKGQGIGVGRREDAWLAEAIIMKDRINSDLASEQWLDSWGEILDQNLLPTGIGSHKGNNVIRNYAENYGPSGDHGAIQFEQGAHFLQTFEGEHHAHQLFCLSRIPRFQRFEDAVIAASKLIGSSHFLTSSNPDRKGPPWYIQIVDPDGTLVLQVSRGQGDYAEGWHGMTLHSYALFLNPLGPHLLFLKELYGPGLDDLPRNDNYELGRAAVFGLLNYTPVDEIAEVPFVPGPDPDPDPEPVVDPPVVEPDPVVEPVIKDLVELQFHVQELQIENDKLKEEAVRWDKVVQIQTKRAVDAENKYTGLLNRIQHYINHGK